MKTNILISSFFFSINFGMTTIVGMTGVPVRKALLLTLVNEIGQITIIVLLILSNYFDDLV